ncbi:MAG: Ig-like domain-containing protein [Methanothrix sp.]|nr:Ig-like domain-containing protein [Methanothrix sp.]MDD4447790.1 Ig-like domain-containing protein [Methanothrix sp.]
MYEGWRFTIPWAMLKTTLIMVLLLTIASCGQEPCSDSDQNCKPLWSLQAGDEAALIQASDGFENDLFSPNTIETTMVAFDFQNQSAPQGILDIIARNDSASIIELSANDINNDLLSYKIIGQPLHGNISGTAPYLMYKPDAGYTGNDSFAVIASSASGTEKNVTVSIDVVSLPHPPYVMIRSPRNGEVFTANPGQLGVTIPIHATSTGDVQSIAFYDSYNPNPIGSGNCEDASGNCPVTIFSQLNIGTHVLTAKAVSAKLGNSCPSLPVTIFINPSQPVVRITSPLPGQIFTSPKMITITAEVIDSNPVNRVEFYENSKLIGFSTASGSTHTYNWENPAPGVHNIMVKAIENSNTFAISKPVLIVVVPEKPLSKSNLALTMSSTSNPAPIGGLFNFVLTVTNRGPDSATGVTVQDFLPPEFAPNSQMASQGSFDSNPMIWNLGDLTKYHSARLVLTVKVLPDAKPGQVANTAYVFGAQVDPDNSNNYATVYTRIEEGRTPASETNSTEVAFADVNATAIAPMDANATEVASVKA